ncbi:methyltransferase [Actinoplanes sp. RD1]|uniref:methyltransferase n=1 Tax=Actinoplanes sp. RD1 TaxID=3064538 RepID=UPI0027403A4A|nr:methyltransferase [Actinoplanes sp. RD1]
MRSRSLTQPPLPAVVREALTGARIDGTRVHLTQQLPPEDYRQVASVLATLGGIWSPTQRATLFPDGSDPHTLITATLAKGVVPLHPRAAEGWVRTPDDLADDLCAYPNSDLAELPAGSAVLEPSAGIGSLVAAMLRANPHLDVAAVEPHPSRASVCAALDPAITVHAETFEAFAARTTATGLRYAAIVMNPPFAVPHDKSIWVEHLRLAWHLLAPGARLVCVVPASIATGPRYTDTRAFVEHHGRHQPMPFEAYKPSGTTFATRLVTLTKPVTPTGNDALFAPPRLAVPQRVDEPQLTGQAAVTMPVQVWFDAWRRRDRVLRYRGRCIVCGWLLWAFDDGDNDPRGALSDFTAGFSLDPTGYDLTGPEVGLCSGCANDAERYRAGWAMARTHWSEPVIIPAVAPAA